MEKLNDEPTQLVSSSRAIPLQSHKLERLHSRGAGRRVRGAAGDDGEVCLNTDTIVLLLYDIFKVYKEPKFNPRLSFSDGFLFGCFCSSG